MAHDTQRHLADAGLTDLHATEHSFTTAGGTAGCLLHRNYVRQLARSLRAEGITDDEQARYGDLMLDSRFRAWFYQFVQTRGRKAQ